MQADVPLGAFLSGGVDSSTVVALMQAQSTRPVKTFSIGFDETRYNEAEYAKEVAGHLGTDHTELYVTPEAARDVIPRLPAMYDEPFSDSSQIPTVLVSEMARRQVTVSLSGDGGDEMFYGYSHYRSSQDIWEKIGWIPLPARRLLGTTLSMLPVTAMNVGLFWLGPMARRLGYPGPVGDRVRKLSEVMGHSPRQMYSRTVTHWQNSTSMVLGSSEAPTLFNKSDDGLDSLGYPELMMYLDSVTYLTDDILAKVDRASMSVGLEARVPLLDHRLFEFAWTLPLNMKIRRSETKWALRQVLYRYVPPRLIERPKQGFSLPIGLWMRGPLRDWAESLLDGSRVRQEGFLDPSPIQEKLHQHLSGSHDWDALIWSVLMFQAWLEDTTRPTTPGSSESVRCSSQGETREQHRGRGPY